MTNRQTAVSAGVCARRWQSAALALALATLVPVVRAEDVWYAVRDGDNPWNITRRYLHSMDYWSRLQQYNAITDPYHIRPGTVLRIPQGWFALRERKAEVLAVEGDVTRVGPGGGLSAIERGSSLAAGSLIRTGADSSLSLGLADGSRVLLRAQGELRLISNRQQDVGPLRDIRLNLREGYLENQVERRSAGGGQFKIRTPNAVAAVRGTQFRIAAAEDKTTAEVIEGAVQATGKVRRIELTAGLGAVFGPAGEVLAARRLLPAPRGSALPSLVERMPAELPIEPVEGAIAYRTLVSANAEFDTVNSDQRTTVAAMRIRDIPDGEYFMRVRAIDPAGMEGFEAERRITINARPEPPFLLAPVFDAIISEARPTFRWTRQTAGATYHFQIARDPQFAMLVTDRADMDSDSFRLPDPLSPGLYYWRVAAIDPREGPGPFGDTQTLRRLPDPPVMQPVQPGAQTPSLRWLGGGSGDRFRLQLARDPAFADLLVDTELEEPEYSLEAFGSGTYYARVLTIAADGYTSPWGDSQQFELPAKWSWYWLLLTVPVLLGM